LWLFIPRWDSDKYLKKSYSFAMSYVQPEVVVFLGDLFDEGSIGDFYDQADNVEKLYY
jgi:metallophosphoesterase superfamily enzyme